MPEQFGDWNTIYKNLNRWSSQGVWAWVLGKVQSLALQRDGLGWVRSNDATIMRVHQYGALLKRDSEGSVELQKGRHGASL
ncbi:hypothetical protein [Glutamicibacter uratoxydans]|uniref:hypothetical protein n=1 Tax=Glutamicibacter uratoxydans TaxID=43667 RepID=UPI003D6EBCE9